MTDLVGLYLEAGLGLGLTAALLALVVQFGGGRVLAAAARWAAFSWVLVALAVAAPLAWRLGDRARGRPAAIEIWGSAGPSWLDGPGLAATTSVVLAAPLGLRPGAERWLGLWVGQPVLQALALLLGLGALLALGRGCWRTRQLRRLCTGLPVWKRVGRVRLCVSDTVSAPFAARAGGLAFIVVPTALLVDPVRLGLVIAHEVAHHRRGDLLLAPWLAGLRGLFFWNPLLAYWQRALLQLEDLACDRRVLARVRVTALEYGQALLWAASAAGRGPDARVALLGGRAMACGSTETLRRRIVMIKRAGKPGGPGGTALGACVLVGMLLGSWAVRGAVGERRLEPSDVAAAAARIEARDGFPVLIHQRVVATLNRRVGTPEGRAQLKTQLERMKTYQPMIDEVFAQRKLPRALIAVALQESGFDREARSSRPVERQAVGIWQFLPGTARRMGLEVTAARDERLDPRRATEAAALMFEKLLQHYGDWPVAIAAYNGGNKTIDAVVAGLSREEARRRLLEHDAEFGRYLVGVMAAVILADNPALVD